MPTPPRRVAFCWANLSGYMAACWRELASRSDVELLVTAFASADADAPFADEELSRGFRCVPHASSARDAGERLRSVLSEFRPDVVAVSGWIDPHYRALAAERFGGARYLMSIDTPADGSLRQRLGRFRYPSYFRSLDGAVVTGERSFQLARVLGVREDRIRRGLYGIDFDRLSGAHESRLGRAEGWPRRFLSVGRADHVKGIDVLLEAYGRYRERAPGEPWPLTYCGTGPLSDRVSSAPGVDYRGFVQPADLPAIQAESGAFVLASRFDPWPLVISESCAAGLPVVCTTSCGSAVELVREYYNGITVAPDRAEDLARALLWVHEHHDRLPGMGARGRDLARAYGASAWADRWTAWVEELTARA